MKLCGNNKQTHYTTLTLKTRSACWSAIFHNFALGMFRFCCRGGQHPPHVAKNIKGLKVSQYFLDYLNYIPVPDFISLIFFQMYLLFLYSCSTLCVFLHQVQIFLPCILFYFFLLPLLSCLWLLLSHFLSSVSSPYINPR